MHTLSIQHSNKLYANTSLEVNQKIVNKVMKYRAIQGSILCDCVNINTVVTDMRKKKKKKL